MIFVTVGTTYGFDVLVKEMDNIAGNLKENIIVQIGNSKYKPKNCKYFTFKNNISQYYKESRLVICHGGAGTNYELLRMGKKIVAVENKNVNDAHQWDLLKKLSEEKYIIWCKDISNIYDSIKKADKFKFRKYLIPDCNIHKKIIGYLG